MKKCTLNIYHNNVLKNTYVWEGDEQVNAKLADLFIDKTVRSRKMRVHAVPYSETLKVTEYFSDDTLGEYKYAYTFEGVRH